MSEKDQPVSVADGVVVSMHYELEVDGEVLDASQLEDPVTFIQGRGQIIPGLERAILGMHIGEAKQVVVQPADGYGESDLTAIRALPRSEFSDEIPLQVGTELQMKDHKGKRIFARIVKVTDESVILDFNEPLAGKTLHFKITIAGLRAARLDEINTGRVIHRSG